MPFFFYLLPSADEPQSRGIAVHGDEHSVIAQHEVIILLVVNRTASVSDVIVSENAGSTRFGSQGGKRDPSGWGSCEFGGDEQRGLPATFFFFSPPHSLVVILTRFFTLSIPASLDLEPHSYLRSRFRIV